jgi:hypothetical protein
MYTLSPSEQFLSEATHRSIRALSEPRRIPWSNFVAVVSALLSGFSPYSSRTKGAPNSFLQNHKKFDI